MTATRTYPQGVPCWIDSEQPDPERARYFYGRLLDWTFEDVGSDDAPYHVASLAGLAVAAIASRPGGTGRRGAAAWNTYVAVDDADASAEAVHAAGGSVDAGPLQSPAGARIARCADPAGAVFGLWQPESRPGAQAVNVPGAWNFSDLHTTDAEGALAFYGEVFGWEAKSIDAGAGEFATLLRVPGYGDHRADTVDPEVRELARHTPEGYQDGVGWVAPLASERDEPHWHLTLLVSDRDEAISTAQQLGAEIVSTRDTRWNRSGLIVDPQGAVLTLSQFSSAA